MVYRFITIALILCAFKQWKQILNNNVSHLLEFWEGYSCRVRLTVLAMIQNNKQWTILSIYDIISNFLYVDTANFRTASPI